MKRAVLALTAVLTALTLSACGGSESYADGVYEGKSEVFIADDGTEQGNGYGVATVTIEGGVITDCTFKTYTPDGIEKDEEYGKGNGEIKNRDYYNKAQKAVAACQEYANMLVANGGTNGIDAISGATKNYDQFLGAVDDALSQARI